MRLFYEKMYVRSCRVAFWEEWEGLEMMGSRYCCLGMHEAISLLGHDEQISHKRTS